MLHVVSFASLDMHKLQVRWMTFGHNLLEGIKNKIRKPGISARTLVVVETVNSLSQKSHVFPRFPERVNTDLAKAKELPGCQYIFSEPISEPYMWYQKLRQTVPEKPSAAVSNLRSKNVSNLPLIPS